MGPGVISPEISGGGGRRRPEDTLARPVNGVGGVWSARRGGRLSRRIPVPGPSASGGCGRCASCGRWASPSLLRSIDRRRSLLSSSFDPEPPRLVPRGRAPSPEARFSRSPSPEGRFSRWAPSLRSSLRSEGGWEGRLDPPATTRASREQGVPGVPCAPGWKTGRGGTGGGWVQHGCGTAGDT